MQRLLRSESSQDQKALIRVPGCFRGRLGKEFLSPKPIASRRSPLRKPAIVDSVAHLTIGLLEHFAMGIFPMTLATMARTFRFGGSTVIVGRTPAFPSLLQS